jgi:hypothetical protein
MTDAVRYAVLFKAHFWNDFCERQLRRLGDRAGTDNIFVVVDETRGPVTGIRHDRIIRMTEATSEAEGYLRYPAGNMFWYNTDYQLYHFCDLFPDYDYIVICEYDCVVDVDIPVIVHAMAARGLGFVGERIRTPASSWYWTPFVRPYYDENVDITGRMVCFAAFSRGFASELQAARREQTRRALAHAIVTPGSDVIVWPNNEAFVGAEIGRLGVAESALSEFGDVSHYDWAPPHLEMRLPRLPGGGFVHPVLDGPRFVLSLLRLKWDLWGLFRARSRLRWQIERHVAVKAVPIFLHYFLQGRN